MAFLQVQCFSEALKVQTTVNVILPEAAQGIGIQASGKEELPKVLYLLHGYSDDHSIWLRRTSVERYTAAYNLAVVMPAVNHSFYCNEVYGERYWDYVAQELPAVMQRFFRLSDKPEDTFVAGLSMGGYGAMKLALSFPERFGAAASFSGAMDIAERSSVHASAEQSRIFGDISQIPGSDNDLFHLLEKNAKAAKRPRLYVSCGTADFLYHQHQKFVPAAKKAGWDVTSYEEPDVGHEWAFWDREISKFIPWMLG
ncbi:MAG: esterase family protein [Christensenellaceae bacterium]|nr:esterase family protein [Christensenellaceae bacterium]